MDNRGATGEGKFEDVVREGDDRRTLKGQHAHLGR